MTRHYSVIMDGGLAVFNAYENEEQAAEHELNLTGKGYKSTSHGDINGEAYLVVYRRPSA